MSSKLSRKDQLELILDAALLAYESAVEWPHSRADFKGQLSGIVTCLICMGEDAAKERVSNLWRSLHDLPAV